MCFKKKRGYYTSRVTFDLAKSLCWCGFESVEVGGMWYNLDGGLVSVESVHSCSAPTYGEVIDWLMGCGVFVSVYYEPERKVWRGDYVSSRSAHFCVVESPDWCVTVEDLLLDILRTVFHCRIFSGENK